MMTRPASFRVMVLTTVAAWGACAAWQHWVPGIYEARASLQVLDLPQAVTDFESAELQTAAREAREAEAGPFAVEPAVGGPLWKMLEPLAGGLRVTPHADGQTLELAFQTPARERAVGELTALIKLWLAEQHTATPAPINAELSSLERDKLRLESDRETRQMRLDDLRSALDELAFTETARLVTLERVKKLSQGLADVRLQRLQLETDVTRLARDFDQSRPVTLAVARISHEPTRLLVQTALGQETLQTELLQAQARLEQATAIYGRKHPYLIQLQEQVAQLNRNVTPAGFAAAEFTAPENGDRSPQQRTVLQLLQDTLEERRGFERDLQQQLELEQSDLLEFTRLDEDRVATENGLQATEGELAAVLKELQSAPAETPPAVARLVQKPWLVPESITPSFGTLMIGGTLAGSLLGWLLARMLAALGFAGRRQRTAANGNRPIEPQLTLRERRELRLAQLHHAR